MGQNLLINLKDKKEMHRQWKQGQITWKGKRDATQFCIDEVRKIKAQQELGLARDTKNSKKVFYRYVTRKQRSN